MPYLTNVGVLLFTKLPQNLFASAITRCILYEGITRDSARRPTEIEGPVSRQIQQAFELTLRSIEKRDIPVRGAIQSETFYKFPAICLREMIANALVHRRYDDTERMIHIRIFKNRIEISSPGKWAVDKKLSDQSVKLNKLESESVKRNLSLVQAITAIKQVEGEGSGIPTALRDCRECDAPEPTVTEQDGYIVVTVFPRRSWESFVKQITLDSREKRLSEKGKVLVCYANKDQNWVSKFLTAIKPIISDENIALWNDNQIRMATDWREAIVKDITAAKLAILFVSPDFLASDFIAESELPPLLHNAEQQGLQILWMPLSYSTYEDTAINSFQAVINPLNPIEILPPVEQSKTFTNIGNQISKLLKGLEVSFDFSQLEPEIAIAHLPSAVEHFVGREKELEQLDQAWEDPGTPLISLVAFGGVGKSTLVAEWLQGLADDDWRGAQYVLGHSFYSQGSRDDAQVSAENFIDKSLRFFGDPNPEKGSAWDKGERLARLIRRTKTLLILDGMEPLQWGTASVEVGRIKDQGLTALVRELAANNPGLCVITTRQAVADIPTTAKIELDALSDQAGAALLDALGVKGTSQELEDASHQVKGHGLALRLLGTYLAKVCNGDVRRIGEVNLSLVDQRLGSHAHKLVERYERFLGDGVELSILRLLGLFDRPAEVDCLAAVCAAPVIPGLTDTLVNLSVNDCQWAVSNLIEYGLLSPETLATKVYQRVSNSQFSILNSLDAHPLIRKYFATQLARQHPDATKEAHRRLYEHLKQVAPELPDTLQEMMPLYHAVVHGGKAGLWQEALNDVFNNRIWRKNENFSANKLGAMGTDLAALAALFEIPFIRPNSNLTEAYQAWVLNKASFRLRALGRLAEANQSMQAGLNREIVRSYWKNAAITAPNLSELHLTLGDVATAVHGGERATELSDRSGDSFQRIANRTNLADALHQAARLQSSHMAFLEAEVRQAERQPQDPLLYSVQGFQYCNLLLDQRLLEPEEALSHPHLEPSAEPEASRNELSSLLRRCGEVRERAEKTLRIAQTSGLSLLTRGLDKLTLGRTYLLEVNLRHENLVESITSEDLTILLQQATHYLNQSVSLLRQAGTQHHIPRGLLARATLWRVSSQLIVDNSQLAKEDYLEKANRDLTEVEQIAGRSNMLIFQIEAALERCRLALAMNNKNQARIKGTIQNFV